MTSYLAGYLCLAGCGLAIAQAENPVGQAGIAVLITATAAAFFPYFRAYLDSKTIPSRVKSLEAQLRDTQKELAEARRQVTVNTDAIGALTPATQALAEKSGIVLAIPPKVEPTSAP